MSKRGRPPLEQPSQRFVITLTLHPGRDDDLIEFLECCPAGYRATAVIAALRSGTLNPTAADPEQVSDAEISETLTDSFLL